MSMVSKLQRQFTGTLLGAMTGDALAKPAKDYSPDELLDRAEIGYEMMGGFYTEDTEMMLTVAEVLLDLGDIDPDPLAHRLGENLDPMRGYNPGALEVMYALQQGRDWRVANRLVFEDGSYGAGSACRAAPVGLFFHDDLDLVVDAAAETARVTHAHPVGEAGAVAVALAVALAVQGEQPRAIYEQVLEWLADTGFGDLVPYLEAMQDLLQVWPDPPDVVQVLGNRLTVQECVPAAVYCVLRYPNNFE
ncbi:MAG: hypothetical protein GYB65_21325, partial [Chloroflexi bacterium]|nr:hypothetical protein [Chloroflexota bacterium]